MKKQQFLTITVVLREKRWKKFHYYYHGIFPDYSGYSSKPKILSSKQIFVPSEQKSSRLIVHVDLF